jgi:hypothetical protein
MKVFYVFLLLPLLSHAITESKTNTKTIQETKLTRPEVAPFSEGSDVVPTPVQQQQERPIEDPEAIKTGPYDKDGNYIYLKKKP